MNKKNVGIELLRIICMCMIIMLHLMVKGGIVEATDRFSSQYFVCWFLELLSICSVDCYALISGYVGANSKVRLKRMTNLWFQVIFYTIILTTIFWILDPAYREKIHVVHALMPVSTGAYWYVSCYFGMFFLMPFMNIAIQKMGRKEMLGCIVAVIALYTIIPTAFNQNPFAAEDGYSVIWLIIMYLTGGYIRKYNVASRISAKCAGLCFIGIVVFTWGLKALMEIATLKVFGAVKYSYTLAFYTTPLTVIEAIFLFLCVVQIDFQSEKLKNFICRISAAAFGVYVIHLQSYIFYNYIGGTTAKYAHSSVGYLLLVIFARLIAIYVICTIIDLLRIQLFKWIGVHKLSEKIDAFATRWFVRLFCKNFEENE